MADIGSLPNFGCVRSRRSRDARGRTIEFDDDVNVFRIFDVWETREQAERFLAEYIQPLIDQGPSAFPNPDNFTQPTRDGFYELHDVASQIIIGAASD